MVDLHEPPGQTTSEDQSAALPSSSSSSSVNEPVDYDEINEDKNQQLGRRLSAPARLKSISNSNNSNEDTISAPPNTAQLGAHATALQQANNSNNHQLKLIDKRFRYSQCHFRTTTSQQHRIRKSTQHRNHHHHHHKSASPLSSSSSASDSAFSQSRSTLGSDCEQSSTTTTTNCFTTTSFLKDSASHQFLIANNKQRQHKLHHHKTTTTNHSQAESQSSSASSSSSSSEVDRESEDSFPSLTHHHAPSHHDQNHFKILWRNLSYKVPEKRLSKLAVKFRKYFNSPPTAAATTTTTKEQQQQSNQLEDGLHHQSTTTTTHNVHNKQRQIIFSNLNGCVKSGQLTAILGPSGAGKTTFLKCLTNSIVEGVSGSIDIVGGPTASSQKHLKLCIIPQKDYLFDNLTVMENLLFASRIKNSNSTMDHKENVNRVAGLLGLQTCLKLKTSRLSGGQYKRVSIAQELLSQPDILILDEPTSGLDSLTCFKTVSVLRDLVNMSQVGLMPPLSIVMTIHQPQIKIFNLFHHVYILSSMGQCVYEGRPEYLVDTVANCCNLLPPPDDQNPASFIIDLGSDVYGAEPIRSLVKLQLNNFLVKHTEVAANGGGGGTTGASVGNSYLQSNIINSSSINNDNKQMFVCCPEGPKTKASSDNKLDGGEFRISERLRKRHNNDHNFWLHTGLLIKRLWMSMWRDSLLAKTRISFHLIIPFVFYFVYSQKSGSANACPHVERELDIRDMMSDTNIQRLTTQHDELILTFENVSLFFLLLYSFSMCVLAVTALSFPLNMQILLKETSNGWYTMPRFVMAKTLADLPVELTMPIISVSIAYAITGQPSSYLSWRMLTVTAVMTLCSLISQTQGLLFGAYFMNNVQAAVFISQASTLPWILLSGFTTRVSELPKVLQWLSFGSIYRLGIESIVAVRYGFGMCPCDQELVNDTPTKMIGIPDQLKSVMSYYMDMYSSSAADSPTTTTTTTDSMVGDPATAMATTINNNSTTKQLDLFEKIASTLSRANTYGVDIVSCNDVRPFIMSAREVDETTLPTFMLILVSVLIGLKILLFYVVRIRAG